MELKNLFNLRKKSSLSDTNHQKVTTLLSKLTIFWREICIN